MTNPLLPDVTGFECDPFGYSAFAWHKFALILAANGIPKDPTKAPTAEDLKEPALWLSQANALSEAAVCLVKNDPKLQNVSAEYRTIVHSQYYAVVLMLVGYSLEVCLKAMMIIESGIDESIANERSHFHHNLHVLASFVPGLSRKDLEILRGLSHFVRWAGRYPDPGSRRLDQATDVFEIGEVNKVTARDLFDLASRVMQHATVVTG
ncbi:hypothetical protein [Coralloluteibacterium stylophorae]|uniref:HEPN domain-containing protein n=1 Tax=Coralloluteibacterium stylophorae TaxID=1776034 RepID=A0A8J7VVK0_9GAMM|nr:hypothetical protein [Coralloluteibacterium stylophorae]MBS7459020.1 hypothetical protein [Coralloluteibacterium stylophorae]